MGWTGQAAAKGAADQFSVKALEEFLSGWAEPIEEAVLSPRKTWDLAASATSAFVHTNPHVAAAIGISSVLSIALATYAYKNSWYSRSTAALGRTFQACYNAFEPVISARVNILGIAFQASVQSNKNLFAGDIAVATGVVDELTAARRRHGFG